ncbi:LacI family transcriptional regulator [Lachnospiraceae bacterium OttesenSCG-928-D06]|nr:LacI family transcriptional regulator [Lachnospiraceae bacterium OttesenSCG-928-D06]
MTIAEIAKNLGVSKSTVSRALSGKGRISENTRLRIQTYVKEHNEAFLKLEALPSAKTQNIGVVIPADAYNTSIPFFQECMLGICEAANLLKYDVLMIRGTAYDISGIQQLVEKRKVDGIILTRSMEGDRGLKYLTDIHFPTGLIGSCDYDEVIQVDTDNKEASHSLISMLVDRGFRKFALITGDATYSVNVKRCQGFLNALEQKHIPKEHQLFYSNVVNMEIIDSVLRDIINKRVECIVCGDDVLCTRIMSRMQAEGYRIPLDVSIVSLYNSTNLECFSPAVTAINISAKQLGNMIARQMIAHLDNHEYEHKTVLDYEILFRKSADIACRI